MEIASRFRNNFTKELSKVSFLIYLKRRTLNQLNVTCWTETGYWFFRLKKVVKVVFTVLAL